MGLALLGVTQSWWRPVLLYPFAAAWNLLIFRAEERRLLGDRCLLPWHSAFWDEFQRMPISGLDDHLVLSTQRRPIEGEAAMRRLESGPQRWAVLRARAILLAREAGRMKDLTKLNDIVSQLPEGERGFLSQTRRLREMVSEISILQNRLSVAYRPVLRELLAQLLVKGIEHFQYQVTGFHEPLVSEFRQASDRWLEEARRQWQETRTALEKEPTPQVFCAGDPVDRENAAFVPRDCVISELENQITLRTGCPGIVLYGLRRMGKTTLLRNLAGFLPTSVQCVWISMQDPSAFVSVEGFCECIMDSISEILPSGRDPGRPPRDLGGLFRFLAQCNNAYKSKDHRLLLMIDEYEILDTMIGDSRSPRDLLAMIRESIQSHRSLTWVFAGSHEITDLSHAPWTSYLVSTRTIRVPLFTTEETRLLLTEPLKYSTLWPSGDMRQIRPNFLPGFWGKGGIDRIHAEAGGWPHLVQLIAETVIDLLNSGTSRHVDSNLLEKALSKAVARGHNVLSLLMRGESLLPGEWDYLKTFRGRDTQPPPHDEAVARSIRRRLLVEERDGAWRLRVPLMQRWLREAFEI
jgi:hypothetical protein